MNEGGPDEATSTDDVPETEPTVDPVIDLIDGGLAPWIETEVPLPTIDPVAGPWDTDHITAEPAESNDNGVPASNGDLIGIGEPTTQDPGAEQVNDEPPPSWNDRLGSAAHAVEDEPPLRDGFEGAGWPRTSLPPRRWSSVNPIRSSIFEMS